MPNHCGSAYSWRHYCRLLSILGVLWVWAVWGNSATGAFILQTNPVGPINVVAGSTGFFDVELLQNDPIASAQNITAFTLEVTLPSDLSIIGVSWLTNQPFLLPASQGAADDEFSISILSSAPNQLSFTVFGNTASVFGTIDGQGGSNTFGLAQIEYLANPTVTSGIFPLLYGTFSELAPIDPVNDPPIALDLAGSLGSFQLEAVPEPSSLRLTLLGGSSLVIFLNRKRPKR